LVPTFYEPEKQPLKELEGSPNKKGTYSNINIIPTTCSTDMGLIPRWHAVLCSFPRPDIHSCGGRMERWEQSPLDKVDIWKAT